MYNFVYHPNAFNKKGEKNYLGADKVLLYVRLAHALGNLKIIIKYFKYHDFFTWGVGVVSKNKTPSPTI